MSSPNLFIIETLDYEDERKELYEGIILHKILKLSQKKTKYFYIRTEKELISMLGKFQKSEYRYLHISCHSNDENMYTTLDKIPFRRLADIMNPYLKNRRLFLSSCSMSNMNLARRIINISGCYSVMGPKEDVQFDKAAIVWATFYHLMLRDGARYMKREMIERNAQAVCKLIGLKMNYYRGSKTKKLIHGMTIGG